jgi:hypothetical protein
LRYVIIWKQKLRQAFGSNEVFEVDAYHCTRDGRPLARLLGTEFL